MCRKKKTGGGGDWRIKLAWLLLENFFQTRNGRTNKFTKTAPMPYPKWAVFNGAAAFALHIVNKIFVLPIKNL